MADELAAAIEAALAGGEILRNRFGGRVEVSYKSELNLVTEADRESERTILDLLRRRAPGAAVLAEESGEREGDTARRFLVDPLDGTTNFAHGYPFFSVSIGFERDSELVLGVVYDPLREELFTAERGEGAFLNGRRLHVSGEKRLSRSLLVTGFPYDLKDDLSGSLRLFERFMGEVRAIRRAGSAALDLCYVAAGRVDAFWEEKLSPWDMAAGAVLVREAGGRVTDFAGGPFDCYGKEIVASNSLLHPSMVRLTGTPE